MKKSISRLFGSGSGFLLLLALAAGVGLLLLGSGRSEGSRTAKEESYTETDMDAVLTELEQRVSALLSQMDGVSEVHVMITPDSSSRGVYLADESYANGSLTKREYITEDGQRERIMLIYPKLRGIAVVCRGGSNPIHKEKITSLLCALFDLSANKVYVTG